MRRASISVSLAYFAFAVLALLKREKSSEFVLLRDEPQLY